MDLQFALIIAMAVIFGLYMAWGIGANDVANAMGTSVGSGALTLRRAVIVAAILEFSGAFFVGAHVSETVRGGIVDPTLFGGHGMDFMLGMLAVLLGAAVWLQLASWKGWPVSTTHSIVGALIGFGIFYGGTKVIHWNEVEAIVASWVISPLLSGIISYVIFNLLLRFIFYRKNPFRSAKRVAPVLIFFVLSILTLSMVFKGLNNLHLNLSLPMSFAIASTVGLVAALLGAWLISRMPDDDESEGNAQPERVMDPALVHALEKASKHLERVALAAPGNVKEDVADVLDEVRRLRYEAQRSYEFHTNTVQYQKVEKLFVYLQILSACFVAFAHGANDVANAIGPMSAVISVAQAAGQSIAAKAPVPMWVLALGGAGIVAGLATWGWRVMETIGRNITQLTPTRGFSAEFGAATTIVLASKMGLPISTTHTLVGAVLGVGLARGLGAINLNTMRDIIVSWLVTIPAGGVLAVFFYCLMRLAV